MLIVCLDDINMATIFLKPVPPPPTAFLVMLYLGKGLLEEGMATHSSGLAWRVPWTEESGGLQSIGLQS